MKLARVMLRKPRKVGRMEMAGTEVTARDCDELRYDDTTDSIVMNGVHVAREEFIEWEKASEQLVCPECGEDFTNGQALGGHMRKHRKAGAA